MRLLRWARSWATYYRSNPDEFRVSRAFLESFVDDEPCTFDHRRRCQAHGFALAPGDRCPQAELKKLLLLAENGDLNGEP